VLKINMLRLGELELATIRNTSGGRSDPKCHERREDNLLTYRRKISPPRVSTGRGSAETLSAKRGTVRFAVTAGVFSVTYEPWSSRIFRSLTE
jgi:hypothetical protein